MQTPPQAIYCAFTGPGAREPWLPPSGMTGEMLRFDFREGGGYRMRLTYNEGRRVGARAPMTPTRSTFA